MLPPGGARTGSRRPRPSRWRPHSPTLSVVDCEAFEIAFTAVADASDDHGGDDEPFPVCRRCGSAVGIFPDQDLDWQHYTGDATTSGFQDTYDPGHRAEVFWLLPDEDPETV
jgi:hypothetical protein